MDPLLPPSDRFNQPDADADLGRILYKTGSSIKQAFRILYHAFLKCCSGILLAILFLFRHIVWIVIGTVLGLGYGWYVMNKNGTKYQSDMIIKTNFNSTRSVYNAIDYLNAALYNGRDEELAAIFHITPKEASMIESFSAEPVESEVIKAQMYRDLFLVNSRNIRNITPDTVWMRTITFADFKKSLTRFDYPYQEISVTATNAFLFSKLQDGFIRQVTQVPLLQEAKKSQIATNAETEELLRTAIGNIDSLRMAYNQRLIKGGSLNDKESNQLTVMQNAQVMRTPELDLYDKQLELQDELRKASARSVTEKEVVEVYSPFSAVGQRVSFLRQSVVRFGSMGFFITISILLLIAFYKALAKMEKRNKLA